MSQMKTTDHNEFLTKLRWKVANQEFKAMQGLRLDCFYFRFIGGGLNPEQQALLVEFMGDTEHFNELTPIDFSLMFLDNSIAFEVLFMYTKKRGILFNFRCYYTIKRLNKQLKHLIN